MKTIHTISYSIPLTKFKAQMFFFTKFFQGEYVRVRECRENEKMFSIYTCKICGNIYQKDWQCYILESFRTNKTWKMV